MKNKLQRREAKLHNIIYVLLGLIIAIQAYRWFIVPDHLHPQVLAEKAYDELDAIAEKAAKLTSREIDQWAYEALKNTIDIRDLAIKAQYVENFEGTMMFRFFELVEEEKFFDFPGFEDEKKSKSFSKLSNSGTERVQTNDLLDEIPVKKRKEASSVIAYNKKHERLAIELFLEYPLIPPGQMLAQGLLESNSGRSYLAAQCNNHFGLKANLNAAGRKLYKEALHDKKKMDKLVRKHKKYFHSTRHTSGVVRRMDEDLSFFFTFSSVKNSYRKYCETLMHAKQKGQPRYKWGLEAVRIGGAVYDMDQVSSQRKAIIKGNGTRSEDRWPSYGKQPKQIKDFYYGKTRVPYYAFVCFAVKASGYATSRKYHEHLLAYYETYELWRIDRKAVRSMSARQRRVYYGGVE